MVIDINLDDGLLDGMAAMQKFCKIAVTEPDVSKVRRTSMMYTQQPFWDMLYSPPRLLQPCQAHAVTRLFTTGDPLPFCSDPSQGCPVPDNRKLESANRASNAPPALPFDGFVFHGVSLSTTC